jgi:UDP-N-acetylglucosamine 2-epimerase (non-hydrolysing)
MKILHVVGSRPGFLRLSPVMRALSRVGVDRQAIVYVGLSADLAPRDSFLADLDLPAPDLVLGVGEGSPAVRTGRAMIGLDSIVSREAPDWIFTVGDGEPTLAAVVVGRRNGTAIARLEAGLRTGDDTEPQETNRLVADRLSDLLFTAQPQAGSRLLAEGVPDHRVHFVGSVVADAVDQLLDRAASLDLPAAMGLDTRSYLLALFRSGDNIDDRERLESILFALDGAALETGLQALLVVEPRLGSRVRRHELGGALAPFTLIEPVSYSELLALIEGAAVVVTDSGEIRDSTLLLGVPSVAVRRPSVRDLIVMSEGSTVVSGDPEGIVDSVRQCHSADRVPFRPERWDGRAAQRIARIAMAGRPNGIHFDRSATA